MGVQAQCPSGSSPECPKNPRTRRFPVVGDSMIDAAICDGDIVTVRRQDSAHHGDSWRPCWTAKPTVKRLRRENGQVWLVPHNTAYDPIPGDGAVILGKVVAVLRTR
ncbi:LexA family protein [Streptomyces zaomyceticus]|uniref:LexA family protein n=1 Tax=Streptomyces zaomyceticus TaxID=68286 RepID=UPI0036B15BBB